MGSSKRDTDFQLAKKRRENTVDELNSLLKKHRTGIHFERNQQHLKTMNIAEKNKYNTVENTIQPAPFERAMSLHYNLIKGDKKIPFIFFYKDGGGVYLKLPKEFKENPDGYLELLEQYKYHFIIVHGGNYSQVIPISTIRKYWKRAKSTSEGNTNRLQFYGAISNIICMPPEKSLFLNPSLIDALKHIMNREE